MTLVDVLRATEYVVPALEIVDARIQDPRKILDTIADNGAAAGIVIGGRPVRPMDVDLRWVGGIMYRNGEIEETGLAAGVLGHPALGVAWLANKLGSHGVGLEAGHLVLAGSFTRVVFARKGDTLHGDFGRAGRHRRAVRLKAPWMELPRNQLQARDCRRQAPDRTVVQPLQQYRSRRRARFRVRLAAARHRAFPQRGPRSAGSNAGARRRYGDAGGPAGLERHGADQALPRHRRTVAAHPLRAECRRGEHAPLPPFDIRHAGSVASPRRAAPAAMAASPII